MTVELAPGMAEEVAQQPQQTADGGLHDSHSLCPVCGAPVRQKLRRGEPKVYCSPHCRKLHWHQLYRPPLTKRRPARARRLCTPRFAARTELPEGLYLAAVAEATARGLSLPVFLRQLLAGVTGWSANDPQPQPQGGTTR